MKSWGNSGCKPRQAKAQDKRLDLAMLFRCYWHCLLCADDDSKKSLWLITSKLTNISPAVFSHITSGGDSGDEDQNGEKGHHAVNGAVLIGEEHVEVDESVWIWVVIRAEVLSVHLFCKHDISDAWVEEKHIEHSWWKVFRCVLWLRWGSVNFSLRKQCSHTLTLYVLKWSDKCRI